MKPLEPKPQVLPKCKRHRMVNPLLRYINETPELLSLLYDMDMLPEQTKEFSKDWARMLMLANAWKKRKNTQ